MSGGKKEKQPRNNKSYSTGLWKHVEVARRTAYDHSLIAQRETQLLSKSRKKLNFPLLSSLLNERLRTDTMTLGKPNVGGSSQLLEIFDPCKNIPKRVEFASTIFKARLLQSIKDNFFRDNSNLSFRCAQVLAQNIDLHGIDNVRYAIQSQPVATMEYFSWMCCKYYNHIKSSNNGSRIMSIFIHEYRHCKVLCLGEFMDDAGLSNLSPVMCHDELLRRETAESWEDADFSQEGLKDVGGNALESLYLFESSVTFEGLSTNAAYALGNLRSLSLFNVQLTGKYPDVDPEQMCLVILDSFSAFFLLETLEIFFCKWANFEGFKMWGKSLMEKQEKAKNPSLSSPASTRYYCHCLTRVNIKGFNWFAFHPTVADLEYEEAARIGTIATNRISAAFASSLGMSVAFDAATNATIND
jgi:hypothetical protein